MGTCYIVGAGSFYGSFTPERGDLIIAADGGYDELTRHGYGCDLLIGDMDSIQEVPEGVELVRHPVRKDETDTALAYLEGRRRGYGSFVLIGCTGGRDDHTLANIALLLRAAKEGALMRLVGERCDMWVLTEGVASVVGDEGKHLSVLAIGGDAEGVYIKGASYEAENITLSEHFPLGVSNLFLDKPVSIRVTKGAVLITRER